MKMSWRRKREKYTISGDIARKMATSRVWFLVDIIEPVNTIDEWDEKGAKECRQEPGYEIGIPESENIPAVT